MSVLNNIAKISVDTEIIEAHDKKSYNTTSSHTKEQVENAKTQNLHSRTFIFVVSKKERIKVFGIMIHY